MLAQLLRIFLLNTCTIASSREQWSWLHERNYADGRHSYEVGNDHLRFPSIAGYVLFSVNFMVLKTARNIHSAESVVRWSVLFHSVASSIEYAHRITVSSSNMIFVYCRLSHHLFTVGRKVDVNVKRPRRKNMSYWLETKEKSTMKRTKYRASYRNQPSWPNRPGYLAIAIHCHLMTGTNMLNYCESRSNVCAS